MKKNKAMTLMELVVVIIIVGILSTVGLVNYRQANVNAIEREARANLMLIQQVEQTRFLEWRVYVSCADTAACNLALHLNLPVRNWDYSVAADNVATPPTFVAAAAPVALSDAANLGAQSFHIGTNDPNACLATVVLPCPAD